jgi:peptide/nickel transport system substrate-binding protein
VEAGEPTQLRITLRKGVKFSDGSEFTADDAKFSLERAKAKSSNYAVYTQGIDRVEKVNATPSTSSRTCPTRCW